MISKLVLAFRMWRRERLLARAANKRFRAYVLETKAEAIYDIAQAALKEDGWI